MSQSRTAKRLSVTFHGWKTHAKGEVDWQACGQMRNENFEWWKEGESTKVGEGTSSCVPLHGTE